MEDGLRVCGWGEVMGESWVDWGLPEQRVQ